MRNGPLEMLASFLLRVYPYRCKACFARFYAFGNSLQGKRDQRGATS